MWLKCTGFHIPDNKLYNGIFSVGIISLFEIRTEDPCNSLPESSSQTTSVLAYQIIRSVLCFPVYELYKKASLGNSHFAYLALVFIEYRLFEVLDILPPFLIAFQLSQIIICQ